MLLTFDLIFMSNKIPEPENQTSPVVKKSGNRKRKFPVISFSMRADIVETFKAVVPNMQRSEVVEKLIERYLRQAKEV